MTDEISGPSTNVFADLDLPHHAKALHIVEHTVDDGVIHPQQERDLISAISEALEEVVKAERGKLVAQHAANRREYMDICEEQSRKISSLEETVAKAFLRCQELEDAIKPFADAFHLDIPVKDGAWRQAHYVLCHSSPVPGGETSSAEGPHQSGDGKSTQT